MDDREASAEVVDSELLTEPNGNDVPWVQVDVENETDVAHGTVRVESRFLSADGSVLDTREQFASYLPPETTWRYYLRSDADVDEVDTVENEIVTDYPQVRSEELEEVTVSNTSMATGADLVNVTGTLEVDDPDVDRVVIVALIYDEHDQFLGTTNTVKPSFDPTQPVEFSSDSDGFRAPAEADEPDSFEILVFDDHP